MADERATREYVVLECKDGTRAVFCGSAGAWTWERNPLLERFLNSEWCLRGADDTLPALAERLRRAVKEGGVVELRRH